MNRREFLRGLGALAASAVVPREKTTEGESAKVAELEAQAHFGWFKYCQMERQASDLAVQVAYWQEQYEQLKEVSELNRMHREAWKNADDRWSLQVTPPDKHGWRFVSLSYDGNRVDHPLRLSDA